jgi:hypothetical protein
LWSHALDQKVTIDVRKTSFWEAFDALEAQTGLTLRSIGSQTVVQAADPLPPGAARPKTSAVYRSGPFKVVADGRGIHSLTIFVEPRLRVLAYAREADVEKMVDTRPAAQRGFRPPEMPQPDFPQHLDPRGGNVFQVRLPHAAPMRDLVYLKGSVRASIARRERTIEIAGIDAANDGVLDRVINGQHVLMNLNSPEPGEFKVMLSVAHPDPPPANLDKTGLPRARPTLLDAAGNALSAPGGSTCASLDRVDFTWEFRATPPFGKPAKLVLSIPDQISEIAIPFEFGQPPPAGDGAKQ